MANRSVLEDLQARIAAIESGDSSSFGQSGDAKVKRRSCGVKRRRAASPSSSWEAEPGEGATGVADDANHSRYDDADAAFKKIIDLVNVSDRSEAAIRQRLATAGFTEPAIDTSVERAKGYGFIDDMRYAEVLIRSRISQGKGSAGIVRELAENRIDIDAVPGWPHEFGVSADEETDRALGLLKRKPPRSKNKRDAAYRRLMQKGYSSSVSAAAARMWAESADCDSGY